MRTNKNNSNNRYILTLIETQSDRAFSTLLSRSRMLTIAGGLTAVLLVVAVMLSLILHRFRVNQEMRKIERENLVLMETFKFWEERTEVLEELLSELSQKTQQIQNMTTYSTPKIEYGVGGRKAVTSLPSVEVPEIRKTETDLIKLESELEWLKRSMAELEKSVNSRKEEIANLPSIRPVRGGWISSKFGQRTDPFTEELVDHPGIDISIRVGSEVYAAAAGVVKEIRETVIPHKGYGKYVLIEHGFGYKTIYAHLSEVLVERGQRIKRWDPIGLSGNTGKSTSPHLHYGVFLNNRPQDPMNFILNQPNP